MILAFENVAFGLFGLLWTHLHFTACRIIFVSISEDNLITETLISILCSNLKGVIPFLLVHWIDLLSIFHDDHLI